MDIQKRDALVRHVNELKARKQVPLVTLEEFFDGNDDGSSIWCNLSGAPQPADVLKILRPLTARADVADIRVMITQIDGGDEWPFSDTVYVVTTATPEDVAAWFDEDHAPDEVYALENPAPTDDLRVPEGYSVIACWWD